ncbi:MAG: hypothetical protein GX773_04430 [Chloroflexi bacterium]|nr:hypothetical protein [Chloroflexota bacterium]
MSDQEFTNVPDSDRWNDMPRPEELARPEEPARPDEPAIPETPIQPAPPVHPEPEPEYFEPIPTSDFAPQSGFTSEPIPPQPQPAIYDPVRDEGEPFVDVTAEREGFAPAPPVTPDYSHSKPPAEKKSNGWVIALIVLLVLCVCLVVFIAVIFTLIASGKYMIEWSYLMDTAVRML